LVSKLVSDLKNAMAITDDSSHPAKKLRRQGMRGVPADQIRTVSNQPGVDLGVIIVFSVYSKYMNVQLSQLKS
jgi:hypothetical protein